MKTKDLKINGKLTTGVLMAGGPGFKIYSATSINGLVVAAGKQLIFVEKDAADFKKINRYLTLPYQPKAEQSVIKGEFQDFLDSRKNLPSPSDDEIVN